MEHGVLQYDEFSFYSRLKVNGKSRRWDVKRLCLPAVLYIMEAILTLPFESVIHRL